MMFINPKNIFKDKKHNKCFFFIGNNSYLLQINLYKLINYYKKYIKNYIVYTFILNNKNFFIIYKILNNNIFINNTLLHIIIPNYYLAINKINKILYIFNKNNIHLLIFTFHNINNIKINKINIKNIYFINCYNPNITKINNFIYKYTKYNNIYINKNISLWISNHYKYDILSLSNFLQTIVKFYKNTHIKFKEILNAIIKNASFYTEEQFINFIIIKNKLFALHIINYYKNNLNIPLLFNKIKNYIFILFYIKYKIFLFDIKINTYYLNIIKITKYNIKNLYKFIKILIKLDYFIKNNEIFFFWVYIKKFILLC